MRIFEINNLYHGAWAENVMKMIWQNLSSLWHDVFYMTTQDIDLPNHIRLSSIQQDIFSRLSQKTNTWWAINISNPLDSMWKRLGLKLKRFLPLRNYLINIKFETILKGLQPDVIHIHNLQPFWVGILEVAKKHNIPTYLTLHGYWPVCPSSLLYTDKEREICHQTSWSHCDMHCGTGNIESVMSKQKTIIESSVTKIIAVSDYVKKRLCDFGYSPEKIITIHNGIDIDRFVPAKSPTRDYILHVWRLSEIKWSKLVLETAWEIPDTKFLFIWSTKPAWEIPKNVEFIEWVEPTKLIHYYQNAKAVVAPSLWPEPHSLVPLEVMACGTPIIATNVWWNSESISPESWILISSSWLKEALLHLSDERLTKIAISWRERVMTSFSLEKMLDAYQEIFWIGDC